MTKQQANPRTQVPSNIMADRLKRLSHSHPGNPRGGAILPPPGRTGRGCAAMSDVHHPRRTGRRADRGLDPPLHRRSVDDLVLMTGEGLRRLMKVVRRLGLEPEFVAAVGRARQIRPWPKTPAAPCARSAWSRRSPPRSRPPRHRRDAVAPRHQGPPARSAALSRQGPRPSDRRDRGARRQGRYGITLCL